MPFKVTETDKNIRIHDRMSDQRSFAVFSVYYRNLYLICSSKSISNNNLAACSNGIKTIEVCTVQMLQSILSASRVKSVAVCQKWQPALFFAEICHSFCIVRAKKCQVSQLTEMHLNGYKFSVHVNVSDSGSNTELFQLIKLTGSHRTTKICKINC